MNPTPFLQHHAHGVLLLIKVQPRASRNEVAGLLGNELKLKVTAPPVDAAANQAVVQFIAGLLDCPPGCVQLVRGRTSRHKQVLLAGLRLDAVAEKFQALVK